jgi:endonuclease/exonuclease/phosphatase family metal-dependent hydrolase
MKKLFKIAGLALTILIIILYLVTCLTPSMSPGRLSFLTLFSLAYLPLLLSYILLMLIWFFINRRVALLLLIFSFAGYKNLTSTIAFNIIDSTWQWKKDTSVIRVMCWNINRLGDPYISHDEIDSTRKQMLAYISKIQPDILCIQDLSSVEERAVTGLFHDNVKDLAINGNFSHYFYPSYFEHEGENYALKMGVAVFSKLSIIDTGSFANQGQIAQERTGYIDLLFHQKPLRIYVAHLSSMGLWPSYNDEAGLNYIKGDSTKKRTSTILSKLGYYGKIHAGEAEVLKQQLNKSPFPFLFSGDLNAVPSGYVYHTLKKDLKDAFLEKGYGFDGTYNRLYPFLRIDVVLHSKEIEIVQYTRPTFGLSDHYPIIIDMRWKK